ncbi:hypothetical protein AVEN_143052-1 [Araneus ventricosus]|uniref:Uncharacterized protein n=1 Tax=Araneus ventricosus TaxID=182803 RepID=A0A4Y2X7X0_ARAVE|nr:hypothetical protein AVEN_143052-1 [Araneus ventricosus]
MEKNRTDEELINSSPSGGDSFEKALKQLKTCLGKDELLIQVYVRKFLSLVLLIRNTPNKFLRNLYLLESKFRTLEILGIIRDKYASMLFTLVESALPEETPRS